MAKKQDIERILLVSLSLSQRVLGEYLQEKIPLDSEAEQIVKKLADQLHRGEEKSTRKEFALQLGIRETFTSKIKYIFARLFIPHDKDWDLPIPGFLFPLFYFLKPFKTIFRGLFFR